VLPGHAGPSTEHFRVARPRTAKSRATHRDCLETAEANGGEAVTNQLQPAQYGTMIQNFAFNRFCEHRDECTDVNVS